MSVLDLALLPRGEEEVRAENITDIETVKLWAVSHDAKIYAWWDEQHRLNDSMRSANKMLEGRISTIEKRIMWVSGAFAGVGALIGTVVSKALQ